MSLGIVGDVIVGVMVSASVGDGICGGFDDGVVLSTCKSHADRVVLR